ncbi:MAG: PD-(D/E)XK nuclease family protein [Actinobacteria bacterium]|nr:PD-(D/E)XK nuclease family protein [Actinomycetota bacterium]
MAQLPRFFSPTAAGTYRQCPLRWKYRYIDKLPDPPGEPALVGTFAHRVLEHLCDEPADDRTHDRAKELAGEAWRWISTRDDFAALGLDAAAERRFRWKAWTAIDALWQLEDPARVAVRSTEQHISTTLDKVPFRGVIDRLDDADDGLVVTDYKSGKPPRRDRRNEALAQVLLYAAAVEADTGERPVRARLLFLGGNREIVETRVDDALLATTTGNLTTTWAALEGDCATDTFAPSPGPLCGWCAYVGTCEEGRSEVMQRAAAGRLRDDAPARQVLDISGA